MINITMFKAFLKSCIITILTLYLLAVPHLIYTFTLSNSFLSLQNFICLILSIISIFIIIYLLNRPITTYIYPKG